MSKQTLKLRKPFDFDGKKLYELSYDTDDITGDQFLEAESLASQLRRSSTNLKAGLMEMDYVLHTYLGYMSITAVHPEIAIEDLKRIKGVDNIAITEIGRDFIMGTSEETSGESVSESVTDDTPKSITPESENSDSEDLEIL
jgi:hypothetical protein